MLVRACAAVVAITLLVAACSSGKPAAKHSPACALITELNGTAASISTANVGDPVAFKQSLDTSVKKYLAILRELRLLVPLEVQASLDRLGGDVQQLRFDDARADRAALDQYETSKCGRPAVTTTT